MALLLPLYIRPVWWLLFICCSGNHSIDSLLQLVRNDISNGIAIICAESSSISLEDLVESSACGCEYVFRRNERTYILCCLGSASPSNVTNQGKTIINVIPVFLTAKTLLMDRTLLHISDSISDQKHGRAYHECNSSTKLNRHVTRGGVNNYLRKSKDVGVGADALFDLQNGKWVSHLERVIFWWHTNFLSFAWVWVSA